MIGRVSAYYGRHDWAVDATLLLAITAAAGVLRLALLGDLPYGVHSDEAQVGTDAHRIISEGWIGLYTHAALGQPAGHAYLTTPSIWLLGDTAFALRLPLALVGVAAVPLLYLLVRVSYARLEAVFASAMLAVSYWHLFYSRVAHWSISYGTIVLAVLLCLSMGMRTRRRAWFVASGGLLGLGVYTYNIYPIAVAAVAVAIIAIGWLRYRGAEWAWWRGSVLVLGGAAVVVALPMIVYLANPHAYYWSHIDNYSDVGVLRSTEFRNANAWEKLDLIVRQAGTFAKAYAVEGHLDNVDGNGLRPVFDIPTLVLLGSGGVVAFRRRGEPMIVMALCCLAIIPLPAVLQRGSIMREPVGAAPFAMFIAALPLAAIWRGASGAGWRWRAAARVAAPIVLMAIAVLTVHDYFWSWRKDAWPRAIYFSEMTSASLYMRALPAGTQIYFYSERASINLETRQFLAPDVSGQDRSYQFSTRGGSTDTSRARPAVFVLLDAYLSLLPALQQRYPDGHERLVARDGKTEFIAYEVPAVPLAAP